MSAKNWVGGVGITILLTIVAFVLYSTQVRTREHRETELPNIEAEEVAPENRLGVDLPGAEQPAETRIGGETSSTAIVADKRIEFLEKVSPLIGTERKRIGKSYDNILNSLDRDSVPFLRELLLDPSYKNRSAFIARMIALLSDKNDKASIEAILAYVRRPDRWGPDEREHGMDFIIGKGQSIRYLGLFNPDLVSATLRNTFTDEGAEELIADWVHTHPSAEPLRLVYILRSSAAKGLVLTRDPENIALVRESYESLAHKLLSAEYKETKEVSYEMLLDTERYLIFVGGMTENDMLEDLGVEQFLRTENTEEWVRTYMRHTSKYDGNGLDDGRTILDRCPICGATSQ